VAIDDVAEEVSESPCNGLRRSRAETRLLCNRGSAPITVVAQLADALLPFAPQRSQPLVERIRHVLDEAPPSAPSAPAPTQSADALAATKTFSPMTSNARNRRPPTTRLSSASHRFVLPTNPIDCAARRRG
jgi:hypothetical protein